jgi:hypothetical protein
MDTALYYTFSTVAQVLAAAIALLGGLALYRLQLLAGTLKDDGVVVYNNYADNSLTNLIESGNYQEASNYIDKNARQFGVVAAAKIKSFQRGVRERNTIISILTRALVITLLGIAYSILVLSMVPWIVRKLDGPIISLVVGFTLLIVALIAYYRLVRAVLSS